jgi:hypothetical protein
MKQIIREILSGKDNRLSSKRIWGSVLSFTGLLSKLILILDGIIFTAAAQFDKIDQSADSLIYTGAALLGLGLGEMFKKEDKKNVE